jgi:hypothetical protein
MVRIKFQDLLGKHVARCLLLISEGLCLVDLLHLSAVAILRCEDEKWGIFQLIRNLDFFNLLTQMLLEEVSQWLIHVLDLLLLLFLRLVLVENFDVFFSD